jgi:hypothetical protein
VETITKNCDQKYILQQSRLNIITAAKFFFSACFLTSSHVWLQESDEDFGDSDIDYIGDYDVYDITVSTSKMEIACYEADQWMIID